MDNKEMIESRIMYAMFLIITRTIRTELSKTEAESLIKKITKNLEELQNDPV